MTQGENQAVIKRARDILVGKVPMPMEQCHEITKALIYKFISVSDAESEADGDAPFYFCGAAQEYRWDALMSMRLPADAIASRYRDGLAHIGGRRDIPQAFQGIYQDAALPCDDAPTVAAFLRAVDAFDTANPETIGDAFEHLLQDTGAQGKAGQFRTPRHIIDFIVGIVNPQSRETILDPACGTAGFLTAAWRHIQRQEGAALTIPDRNRVAGRLVGYDLAPDMVKLASVNLFLQHNQEPRVEVYDTVSHDAHWNDHYDVILANPPFMSPAGIIKPHSRFYTRAKRTEVLFVDYIASHLNPHGRAGIIVPEGIIFQSQQAYRQLRKLLVTEYLAAVVSLPAGVFQPYSGVKTSILILDKSLAARAETVAFFQVAQDGFDLGAQRRPIDRDDLPLVRAELQEYLRRLRAGESLADFAPPTGLIVAKSRLAEGGEYNLSGERYRERGRQISAYPMVKIGDVIKTVTPPAKIPKTAFAPVGRFPIIDQSQNDIAGWTNDESAVITPAKPLVIFGDHTCAVKLASTPFAQGADGIKIIQTMDVLEPAYLFHTLRSRPLETDGYKRHFSKLKETQIPLPPLSVQQELVAEVAGYEQVIAGARQVVANWRPRVAVNPEWDVVALGEIAEVASGNPAPQGNEYFQGGNFPFIRTADVGAVHLSDNFRGTKDKVNQRAVDEKRLRLFPAGTILFPKSGASTFLNHRVVMGKPAYVASHLAGIVCNPEKALPKYVYQLLCQVDARQLTADQAYPSLRLSEIGKIQIPLPPLSVQQEIVAGIEEERRRVTAAGELAGLVGGRLRGAVGRVWGE